MNKKTVIPGLFKDVYRNKRVLITGHTGFKGSWLATWLLSMGAEVAGYSLYLPSKPCNFSVCGLEKRVMSIKGDIRDISKLKSVFERFNPQMVFHLAAQSIVRKSFDEPKETFDTNIGGTINVLECVKNSSGVKSAVIITSDKCYRNNEWVWGYRENDALGGFDPYSASKAGAEIAFKSYSESVYKRNKLNKNIATARAGNVIGGGDWADYRVIPDCVRAWSKNKEVMVRSPESTRPWQHVLEPLSGYLWLGSNLYESSGLNGESFNFGPGNNVDKSVKELIEKFTVFWGRAGWKNAVKRDDKNESSLLRLSCDKAGSRLGWHAVLGFEDTVRLTAEWYKSYYSGKTNMYEISLEQIKEYIRSAREKRLVWAV